MRGGEAVIRALEKEGIKYISGFSGGGLAPLWEPLRTSDSIRVFAARHERLGVEIADGYARATGEVGVAMTGTGPGATNTLTGIADCYADNVPVLLLMGQHPLRNLGKEYQQVVSASIFDGLVKVERHVYTGRRHPQHHPPGLHGAALRLARTGRAGDAPGRAECRGGRRGVAV